MAILDIESVRRILGPEAVTRIGGLGLLTAAIMGLLGAHMEDVRLTKALESIRKKKRMPKDIGFKYDEDEDSNSMNKRGSFLIPTDIELTSLERPIVEFLRENPLLTGLAIFGLPPLIGLTYLATRSAAKSRYLSKRKEEAEKKLQEAKKRLLRPGRNNNEDEDSYITKKSSVKTANLGVLSKAIGLLVGLSLLYAGAAWLSAKKKQSGERFDIEKALSVRSALSPMGTNVPVEITPDELSRLRSVFKKEKEEIV